MDRRGDVRRTTQISSGKRYALPKKVNASASDCLWLLLGSSTAAAQLAATPLDAVGSPESRAFTSCSAPSQFSKALSAENSSFCARKYAASAIIRCHSG